MKQLRVILLLLLFLQSKIGVAFNVHYCGAHIAKISWAFDAKGCGMEKKIPITEEHQFSQKNCCEDDLIISQNDRPDRRVPGGPGEAARPGRSPPGWRRPVGSPDRGAGVCLGN